MAEERPNCGEQVIPEDLPPILINFGTNCPSTGLKRKEKSGNEERCEIQANPSLLSNKKRKKTRLAEKKNAGKRSKLQASQSVGPKGKQRKTRDDRDDGRRCVVIGCQSKGSRSGPIKFYAFPGQPWEKEKRETWIKLMKKINDDGTEWKPGPRSYICSAHFVNNEKSEHPLSPSFMPTIFPKEYEVKPLSKAEIDRMTQLQKQHTKLVAVDPSPISYRSTVSTTGLKKMRTIFTNTDHVKIPYRIDASTQTARLTFPPSCLIKNTPKKNTRDKETCTYTLPQKVGFLGYASISSDKELQKFAGVSKDAFEELLRSLPDKKEGKLDKRNRLLLFLNKMKTDVSFTVLGTIFQVCSMTARRVFETIRKELPPEQVSKLTTAVDKTKSAQDRSAAELNDVYAHLQGRDQQLLQYL